MNYYERHLGDYMKNCGHLSLLEHGVYVRLLDVYYTREAPIPAEKAARLIGAATPETLQALQDVLEEFFTLVDGFWHQERADEDIAAYQAGEPERIVKKANEDNRLARHRAERADLFKIITDAGLHAPWNTNIKDLRKLVEEVKAENPDKPETPATKPATGTATPATATHTPIPNTQYPLPSSKASDTREKLPGKICAKLKDEFQILDINPQNPDYLMLISQGVTEEEFMFAAGYAHSQNKASFGWIVARLKGQRNDAKNGSSTPTGYKPSARDQGRAVAAASFMDVGTEDQPQEIEIPGGENVKLK